MPFAWYGAIRCSSLVHDGKQQYQDTRWRNSDSACENKPAHLDTVVSDNVLPLVGTGAQRMHETLRRASPTTRMAWSVSSQQAHCPPELVSPPLDPISSSPDPRAWCHSDASGTLSFAKATSCSQNIGRRYLHAWGESVTRKLGTRRRPGSHGRVGGGRDDVRIDVGSDKRAPRGVR